MNFSETRRKAKYIENNKTRQWEAQSGKSRKRKTWKIG